VQRLPFLTIAGALVCGPVFGVAITSTSNLPPDSGEYRTPAQVQADYQAGINIISLENIQHHFFFNITHPACGAGCEFDQFGSAVDADLTFNGSAQGHIALPGQVLVIVFNKNVGSPGTPFPTEMLQLNLAGNTPLGPVMIRESPTLASTGQTRIDDLGNGSFRIDSFFDVFTELSLDGGQSWIPQSNGPSRVNLEEAVPEPGTLLLVGTVLLVLGAFPERVRQLRCGRTWPRLP
jgi:hypothetical protein